MSLAIGIIGVVLLLLGLASRKPRGGRTCDHDARVSRPAWSVEDQELIDPDEPDALSE
ncbi:hypothetical protein [Caenimonas sedimenti]|uniref:hypothetical protein n=1 Tax=Caenimonas sedimenti TaxID=2596921 RepID=UPI001646C15F|nr:hypothetical protein [Caenimonas sedimenti]